MHDDQSKTGDPAVGSTRLLADVAQYLASDGSFGLYDARAMIAARERLFVAVGGAPTVAAARQRIIDGLSANARTE